MFNNRIILTTIISFFLFIPFVANSEDDKMKNKEEIQVMSLINKMTSNLQGGDITKVMSTYETQAIVMFEPGVAVADRKAIENIFVQMATLKPEVTYSGHEVFIVENIAMHISPWSMTGKNQDGQEIKQSGLSVAILRRQTDGSWKMIIDNPYASRLLTQ